MTEKAMSTRVRFNRVQKELAQLGVAYLPVTGICRCCLTPQDFADKNPHFTEVTDETPLLYTAHGLEREYRFNRKGDLLVNEFYGSERVASEVTVGHDGMTGQLWTQVEEVFKKYGMELEVPMDENTTGELCF